MDVQPNDTDDDARRLGQLEGERFDRELREREQRHREERLARLAVGGERDGLLDGALGGDGAAAGATAARLQRDVERLAAFHDAVVHSKAWWLIQALRRLFGRAW